MGFYIRKSVSVGPFRLNLSKSGLGLSVGVKGFRVGVGPAGQYIHMGRGGIYYRKTFSSPQQNARGTVGRESIQPSPPPMLEDWSLGPMSEYRSVNSLELADSDSRGLLNELNTRRNVVALFPFAMAGALMLLAALWNAKLPYWLLAALACPSAFGLYWLHQRDEVRRTTALFYSLDGAVGPAFERLCSTFESLTGCGRIWRVDGAADVLDSKYHAGAGSIVRRSKITPCFQDPPGVRSNISVPVLPLAENTLYLFPDRILVLGRSGWGAIGWDQLMTDAFLTQFIEEETVPHDAQIVGHTWRYVNRSGGPDRRFSNNRQIPICSYGLLILDTDSGLDESIHVSKSQVAIDVSNALGEMAEALMTDKGPECAKLPEEERKNSEHDPLTQYQMGWACENGDGVPKDFQEAAKWYQLAAARGFADAQNNLGWLYQHGNGVQKDIGAAVRWYRLAVAQGHDWAQANLGTLYHLGEGVPQDFLEATRLFRAAAEQGNARAQYNLGASLLGGERTPKNCQEAVRFYRLAADQGYDDAQVVLGEIYFVGLAGVPKNLSEAVRLFTLVAELGNARAQFCLGYMFAKGEGVPKDEAKAVLFYQQSADQGYPGAQSNLGEMYKEGRSVRKDLVEAFRLFSLAANSGEADAQYEVGKAYERGNGTTKDDVQAAYWYKLAAAQDYAAALNRLKELSLA